MKSSWAKFDALFYGEIPRSLINEPIVDFSVDFVVKGESALDRARRRWRCEPKLIRGDKDERERT